MRYIWKSIRLLKRFIITAIVKLMAKKAGEGLIVNNWSTVSKNTVLGKNVNFNGIKIMGDGECIIGDNFHSGSECQILTQNHNYDKGKKIPYDDTYIVGKVSIGDNVWIGNRVIILPGVTIGEGAIIQAGSVVVNDIQKCAIAGGHPARVFSYRDINHYELLKKEQEYF